MSEECNLAAFLLDRHLAEGQANEVAVYKEHKDTTYAVAKAGNLFSLSDRSIATMNNFVLPGIQTTTPGVATQG